MDNFVPMRREVVGTKEDTEAKATTKTITDCNIFVWKRLCCPSWDMKQLACCSNKPLHFCKKADDRVAWLGCLLLVVDGLTRPTSTLHGINLITRTGQPVAGRRVPTLISHQGKKQKENEVCQQRAKADTKDINNEQ